MGNVTIMVNSSSFSFSFLTFLSVGLLLHPFRIAAAATTASSSSSSSSSHQPSPSTHLPPLPLPPHHHHLLLLLHYLLLTLSSNPSSTLFSFRSNLRNSNPAQKSNGEVSLVSGSAMFSSNMYVTTASSQASTLCLVKAFMSTPVSIRSSTWRRSEAGRISRSVR